MPDVADSSAAVSNAPSLSDDLAEMFGEIPEGHGETSEPESTSAAGTTLAEPATGTETETPAAVPETGTPASDGTTPAALAPVEDDPWKDTTAATFTVNGRSLTNEDIRVFKEGGAVIRQDALPNVLNKLSERESLYERNRAQSVEYQTLARATDWTDQSGKQITGPEAAIEMRIASASMFAENKLLVDVLTDPDKLLSIITTEQVPDGRGGVRERVVVNPAALAQLQRENALQQRELSAKIRDHYKGILADVAKPQPAPINYEAEAPKLIASLATDAQLDPNVLTAEDRKLLADLMPEHTQNGLVSVKWQNLAKSFMRDRAAQKANLASTVSVTEKATKDAQARMAAAARGVKPVTQPTTPNAAITKEPTATAVRQQSESDLWDMMQKAGAAAMRSRV